jgi:hypothetical protein
MLNKININHQKQILFIYIALAVVTLAVFWQVHQYDFINYDDNVYITANDHIQGITLDGIRWAFSTTYAEFWHPLTWLSLMFDYQLYGLQAGGYHLTNLILHVLSTLLLFWLFNRMTKSIWKSAFVAALFALHPLHVQSVAWIAERKDVLSAFFWMLTLCLYVYYTEKPVIKRYLLVLFSFLLALMSKPIVVTLPVIMILLDYWPLGRLQSQKIGNNLSDIMPVSTNKRKKKTKTKKESLKENISLRNNRKLSETKIIGILPLWQLREKIPFFVLSAVFSIITVYAHYIPSVIENFNDPLYFRMASATVSFVTYLEKTFWPHNLAICYPVLDQLPAWQVLSASLLILVVSAVVIVSVKRLPYLFVGWLWYIITLLPVIGIVQAKIPVIAGQYTYLPLIGISIMLAWSIPLLFPQEETQKKILFPVGIVVLAILAVLTWKQCGYWKNSIEIFTHALSTTKNNYIAYDNRGIAYYELGEYQRAVDDFNKGINFKSDNYKAYNNRGNTYVKLGQYQLAIEDFNEAIRIIPDYAQAFNGRGLAYLLQGNKELGCHDAQKACELEYCELLKLAKSKGLCR